MVQSCLASSFPVFFIVVLEPGGVSDILTPKEYFVTCCLSSLGPAVALYVPRQVWASALLCLLGAPTLGPC